MVFVNPLLLAGAGLVVLPIVLHLIMRQKPKLLEFPALRFLQRRHDANRRRLRLRHLLLLALRVLLIAVLALALARPSIKLSAGTFGNQREPVAVAVIVDTSLRMDYRQENRTRLEAAKELAHWLVGQFPEGSEVVVLDGRPESRAFTVDPRVAEDRIERMAVAGSAVPLTEVVDKALAGLAESGLERKELYVFSDFSRAAWPENAASELRAAIAKTTTAGAYLIDVGVEKPQNMALGDLRLSAQAINQGAPLTIDATATCRGEGGRRMIELILLERVAGGEVREVKRDEKPVDLNDGQAVPVTFDLAGLTVGLHQGFVRVAGQDALGADDRRYFTVRVRPAPEVLLAAPQPLRRTAVYFEEAIAPSALRAKGRAPYRVKTLPLDRLAGEPLAKYQAVVVLDPGAIGQQAWQNLADYASAGGGVGVFLGRNANRELTAINEEPAQRILPGKLVRQARAPQGDVWLAPRDADYEHRALAEFRDIAGSVPWQAFPVFHYWQLRDLPSDVGVVAHFSNRDPAIFARTVGKGRVLTMATPVSDDPNRDPWNLLPTGDDPWPFVLLANGMVAHLVGGETEQLDCLAGEKLSLRLDPQRQFRSYLLTGPGEDARLEIDPKQQVLPIDGTDQPGNYQVRAGGSEGGFSTGFSVNVPAAAMQLDRLAEDDLHKLLDPLPFRVARSQEQIEFSVSRGRVGRELYGLLILIFVAMLGLEHLVANRFYRQ